MATDRYLRTSLLVVQHARRRYALVHPGSGVALLTDATGAAAARRFIRGWSDGAVGRWLSQSIPNAPLTLARLLARLDVIGATTDLPPRRTLRWGVRVLASLTLGYLLSGVIAVLPHAPPQAIRALLNALPGTPLVRRAVGQIAPYVLPRLDAAGFGNRSTEWKCGVIRGCAATSTRTSVLMVAAHAASRQKIEHLTSVLVQPRSSRALREALTQANGAIITGLHSDLFPLPGAQVYGWRMPLLGVADEAATLMPFETDAELTLNAGMASQIVSSRSPMLLRTLAHHLHAGGVVHILLDAVLDRPAAGAPAVSFLGYRLRRVEGPAWLSVRTGKPLIFAGVYRAGRQTCYDLSASLYADPTLPEDRRVAELSERLYGVAEAFVRRHPEAWMGWSYLPMLLAAEHRETEAGALVTSARAHEA